MTKITVGVPRALAMLHPSIGAGKIWRNVLPRLEHSARTVVMEPRRDHGREIDVWLSDGHHGPLDVDEPVVAHLHEAPWSDPAVRATVDEAFVERIDAQSAAAAAAARQVVTGSEAGRTELMGRYSIAPERIHVALNGVDHDGTGAAHRRPATAAAPSGQVDRAGVAVQLGPDSCGDLGGASSGGRWGLAASTYPKLL